MSLKVTTNNERHIMRIIALFAFVFIFCVNIFSEDKFELLLEVRIPSLMSSAQNLTSLSENVLPGSSGIIGVGVASLAFDPKLAGFDLTSPIQILGFGSKTCEQNEMQWCIVMSPKNKDNFTTQINDKKRTVFVRGIGERAVLSYNKALADSIIDIPEVKDEKAEYDIKLIFYPSKYLDIFPEGLASLRKEITELALKKSGRKEEDLNSFKVFSLKMTELEKAVSLLSKTDFNVNFHKDKLSVKSEFSPLEGSSAESFIKTQTKTTVTSNSCDTGTGAIISFGRINMTDQLKNEILETLKKVLIETTDDYNPEITGLISEIAKSFSGEFRFRMDSFTPESPCFLETSVSNGKYQILKDFISDRKTIKEVKKGIYSFNPENVDKENYNSFINLNEKNSRIVYGKTKMSTVEKLIMEGIATSPDKHENADIFLYVFSSDENDSRKPLLNSFFIFNGKTLTINTEVFEECLIKAVPKNLIPKKPQGDLGKGE